MKVNDIVAGGRLITAGRTYCRPAVSIVTPTFRRNAEGLLAKCLDSAMAQTFDNFELIIVDDGSSDGSEETIRNAALCDDRIVYLRHEKNCGLPALRTNEGILRARGEAISFLFDDNVFRPDFINSAWTELQRSAVDVVYANVHMYAREGKDFLLGGWPLTLELLRNLNTIPNGGVMVRRSLFDKVGLYDPHILMRRVCDWDLWLRALSLGATLRHIDGIAAFEHGLISDSSIGNTVEWDVKVAYAYMLDEARVLERSAALTPERIGCYDVLDPSRIRRYVRNRQEWNELLETVYVPYLQRHGTVELDVSYPGNRAAHRDPEIGWNSEWSLVTERRRYLIVANSINPWAAFWIESLKAQPGAIVINCPEWQFSAFKPEDVDLVVLMDCSAAFILPQLDSFMAAAVPVIYVLGYGEQPTLDAPNTIASRYFENNDHIKQLLGPDFYFPQVGIGFGHRRSQYAKLLAQDAVAIVCRPDDARALDAHQFVPFPFTGARMQLSPQVDPSPRPVIVYDGDARRCADADEIIKAPDRVSAAEDEWPVRSSWEGLGAILETRPKSHVVVDAEVLNVSPLGERVGLAALMERRDTRVSSATCSDADVRIGDGEPKQWGEWISNLALCMQVARQFARARARKPQLPRAGIFLNSEMFSGSEVYGLMLARSLRQVGCEVSIFVPEATLYGSDSDQSQLNRWAAEHMLEISKAPYQSGASYLHVDAVTRDNQLRALRDFVREKELDVVLCAGFMPVFAALPAEGFLVLMTLFQPSAYPQHELAFLRGRVSGVLSDSMWALDSHLKLIGSPATLVRAMVPIAPQANLPPQAHSADEIRIAVGGTLQPRKRQLEAVRAAALLRDKGIIVHLNLYGYQLEILQGYLQEISDAIDRLDLHQIVTRHDLTPVERIASENDIVLCASIDESLPQTLIELMRRGLLGVAGLSGGIDELIEDGRTGYLSEDLSSHGIAELLSRAIADRDRWTEIISAAQKRIERDYAIGTNTNALLKLMLESAQLESSPFGRLCANPAARVNKTAPVEP